jgi:hypothetical protein
MGEMSAPAHRPADDDLGIPSPVSHDEKTLEVLNDGVPEPVRADEPTVPVKSSLEKILRHEMLRHRSADKDAR